MTEAEWLAATDLPPLLHFARPFLSERKWRLFTCACARQLFPNNAHPDLSRGADAAEQMADGTARPAVTEHTRELFGSLFYVSDFAARGFAGENMAPATLIRHAIAPQIDQVTKGAAYLSDYDADAGAAATYTGVSWLRDILGNPFRPIGLPGWRTDTVTSLARQMYSASDFSAMPILADALQDAGCDNADILNHCRGEGPHVRGCWVVDALLGKA